MNSYIFYMVVNTHMNCNYPQHDLCKQVADCPLKYGNTFTSKTSKEITYYLQVLDDCYKDMHLYENTLHDINRGMYNTAHGQYNNIPKCNVMNHPITKPSDVYYNLDLERIEKNIKVTKDTISELRKEEHKVVKTLKRRERRSKTYGI